MWKNVEITGYVKVNSIIPNDNHKVNYTDLAWFARGGTHTQTSPCEGLALIGGIHDDGSVGWKKRYGLPVVIRMNWLKLNPLIQ